MQPIKSSRTVKYKNRNKKFKKKIQMKLSLPHSDCLIVREILSPKGW